MAGSAHNGGPREEQGRLIRFPCGQWVPEDGIEPLNGPRRMTDSTREVHDGDIRDRGSARLRGRSWELAAYGARPKKSPQIASSRPDEGFII